MLGAVVVAGIHDVEDEICVGHLLEGGAKGREEVFRKVADEPHRVGDNHLAVVGKTQPPRAGIQRCEEFVLRHRLAVGKGVEQGALTRIGVPHDADDRHRLALAPTAPLLALLTRFF